MVMRDACPVCGSQQFKKNGHTHTGKQNHRCKACGRQFVVHAEHCVIPEEQRTLVQRLLREKISLHGICRAVGVSIRWLMRFMIDCFNAAPEHLHVHLPSAPAAVMIRRLQAEADEMCSFVEKKADQQLDPTTRQVIAFHVGDRSRDSAKQLWANIPEVYREQATFHTDQYDAYKMTPTKASLRLRNTKPSRSTPGRQTTSSASITPCGNASPVSYVTRWRSPKSWPIILVRDGISSATTT
jgi:insertion element IS1 protein InsB